MSSGPDLYLVCKSCGAEVSPYITECPYCGTRIQKRAPKLDRGGVPKAPRKARSRPQLPRLRPGEIPGIRADRRPFVRLDDRARLRARHGRAEGRPARVRRRRTRRRLRGPVARVHDAVRLRRRPATRRCAVGAIALFGWLLERRHGWWAPLLVFLICGAGGAYVAVGPAGREDRARGQRRRARPARRVDDARRARPPEGPRGRQRPAGRDGDRRRAGPAAARDHGRQRDRGRRRRRGGHPARADPGEAAER